jgi:hypothetical protein
VARPGRASLARRRAPARRCVDGSCGARGALRRPRRARRHRPGLGRVRSPVGLRRFDHQGDHRRPLGAARGRPGHEGRLTRAPPGARDPRRRLCVPRLRAAAGVVRRPSWVQPVGATPPAR